MRALLNGSPSSDAAQPTVDDLLEQAYGDRSPAVRWNMVTTLDGSAVGGDGRSGSINDDGDHLVFQFLRGWAEVVIVGASTAAAENYRPLRGPDPAGGEQNDGPLLVVLTRSGDLPPLLTDAGPDRVRLMRGVPPHEVVDELRAQGFTRILFEGGPRLADAFLRAGRIDELCLTISPLLVGGAGPRIVVGEALRVQPTLVSVLEHEGTLLTRWTL